MMDERLTTFVYEVTEQRLTCLLSISGLFYFFAACLARMFAPTLPLPKRM